MYQVQYFKDLLEVKEEGQESKVQYCAKAAKWNFNSKVLESNLSKSLRDGGVLFLLTAV